MGAGGPKLIAAFPRHNQATREQSAEMEGDPDAAEKREAALAEDGPAHPVRLTLLAVMFLLREVELSAALHSDLHLNLRDKEVSWKLSSSKADTQGRGVSRTWRCICDHGALPCPFHLLLDHLRWLSRMPMLDHSTLADFHLP